MKLGAVYVRACVPVCVWGWSIWNRHAGSGECGCTKAIPQQKPNHHQPVSTLITPVGLPIIKAKERGKKGWKIKKKKVPKPLVSLCAL